MSRSRRALGLVVAGALGSIAGPALADDGACAAVLAAARSIGTAPQYRSVLVATSPTRRRPFEREQIVVGDLIYATPLDGGRWMKLPMTESDRGQLAAGLVRYPPHDCEAAESAGDTGTRIYTYRQDVSGPNSASTRFWVGGRDGLPRRIESEEGTVRIVITLEYEDVKPPEIHEPGPPTLEGHGGR